MDCRDFRKLASKMYDGEGDDAEETELARHLAGCESCRTFHEALEDITVLHGKMEQAEPPAGLVDSVLSRTGRNGLMPAWWKAAVGVAAVAVIVLGIWTGDYITSKYSGAPSVQQAELFEMEYLGPHPPGSLGETLDRSLEGEADV